MKTFIFKTATFTAVLFALLFLIKRSVPYSWGNSRMFQKIEQLSTDTTNYDCLFFGSSKARSHINPILFDSITNLQSYNMGTSATHFLETHYLLEYLFEKYPINQPTKIFLIEKKTSRPQEKNFQTVRKKYYFDFKRLKMGLWGGSKKNKNPNLKQIYMYLISYIENQLCIGELRAIKDFHLGNVKKLPNLVLENQRGFYPMEQRLKLTRNNNYILKSKQIYLNSKAAKENKPVNEQDKTMIIERLSAEELGINIYGKQVEFYYINPIKLEVKYHFDKTHFNKKGAEIFTRKLAEAVNRELSD